MAKNGFSHLFSILITHKNLEFSDSVSCASIELLIRIVSHFVNESLSSKAFFVLKGVNFAKLVIKMIEIIEQCINREFEGITMIESALGLMLPLIVNDPDLLSELYKRTSFTSLINYLLDSHKISVRQSIKFMITHMIEAIPSLSNNLEPPAVFFAKILIKKLPVEHNENCDEYFDILVKLYRNDQENVEILKFCVEMIKKINVVEDKRLSNQNKVVTGYMELASAIVKSNKDLYSDLIVYIYNALFEILANSVIPSPKFKHESTRKSAFKLLLSLTSDNPLNSALLLKLLTKNHSNSKNFSTFDTEIQARSATGYVGLKNFGATCYMNSLIQQLFMILPFRKGIQNVEVPVNDPDDDIEDSLIYQLQNLL